MSTIREFAKCWGEQVEAIVASRYYADVGRAREFLARHVLPAWRAMEEAATDEEVKRKYRMTETQVLMVHLFAHGVLGVCVVDEAAPRLATWRPSRSKGTGGAPLVQRVISTREIARMVGRSPSAVGRALRRFKGLEGPKAKKGVWNVISMPAGVALDGMLSMHTRHPYMYAGHEYAEARSYARACRQHHGRFARRQTGWCVDAMKNAGMPLKDAPKAKPRKAERAAECF
jgi:hypothetical protein